MQVGLYQTTLWVWGILEEARGRMDGIPLVIESMVWACVSKHTFGEELEFEAAGKGTFGLAVS